MERYQKTDWEDGQIILERDLDKIEDQLELLTDQDITLEDSISALQNKVNQDKSEINEKIDSITKTANCNYTERIANIKNYSFSDTLRKINVNGNYIKMVRTGRGNDFGLLSIIGEPSFKIGTYSDANVKELIQNGKCLTIDTDSFFMDKQKYALHISYHLNTDMLGSMPGIGIATYNAETDILLHKHVMPSSNLQLYSIDLEQDFINAVNTNHNLLIYLYVRGPGLSTATGATADIVWDISAEPDYVSDVIAITQAELDAKDEQLNRTKAPIIQNNSNSAEMVTFIDGSADLPIELIMQVQGNNQETINLYRAGKNYLNITLESQTIDGITFTNNGDGTIRVNGTASAQVYLPIGSTDELEEDNYTWAGNPIGADIATYFMTRNNGSGNFYTEISNSYTISGIQTPRIYIREGASVDVTFKPGIYKTADLMSKNIQLPNPPGRINEGELTIYYDGTGKLKIGAISYSLTAEQIGPITSLEGINNIWGSGSIAVKYSADTKTYIDHSNDSLMPIIDQHNSLINRFSFITKNQSADTNMWVASDDFSNLGYNYRCAFVIGKDSYAFASYQPLEVSGSSVNMTNVNNYLAPFCKIERSGAISLVNIYSKTNDYTITQGILMLIRAY